jgi:proteic killer suppression protein
MIVSFRDRETERIWTGEGNWLEPLHGDRLGQFSIRVNDQWRNCFRWTAGGPADVEIVDYHS